MAYSLTSMVTGSIDSFGLLVAMRVVLGVAMAATDPFAFSIMADYFKPNELATANSIWAAASFLGSGICALMIMLIA